ADQLDKYFVAGITRERHRIVEPGRGSEVQSPLLAAVARRNTGPSDRAAAAHGKLVALALHQPAERRSHRAEPCDADAERRVHELLSSAADRAPQRRHQAGTAAPLAVTLGVARGLPQRGERYDVVQRLVGRFKEPAEVPRRLADALLVL